MMTATVIRQIGAEPITLEEAYHHLRLDPIDSSDVTGRPDDTLIESYIVAAREWCERFTGLTLVLTELEVSFTAWPDPIELPGPPFIALERVTVSDDTSDPDLDLADFVVDTSNPTYSVVSPYVGVTLPVISTGDRARIRYFAGYGDESAAYAEIPRSIKVAMLLLLGHWYSMREAVIEGQSAPLPLGVEALLRPHRVLTGFA